VDGIEELVVGVPFLQEERNDREECANPEQMQQARVDLAYAVHATRTDG